ncbi:hypothetical protein NQ317_006250 [Molorchus minor]|uniref:Neuroglian n=1 Tax=Molorchus minor TaxID=1323400 RepID=A0ABQ9K5I4_9CUCU|nr:hypothetical protein NQ317_006250 [Molorchus minor]
MRKMCIHSYTMKHSLGLLFVLIIHINSSFTREVPSPPYIVKQPPTDEVLFQVESTGENDKPFYIECEAIGEPAPKYYWIKNGKKFEWQSYDDRISQQPGRGTLSISKPSDVDLGQYQCFAENQYGVATSNSVFMRKAELNSFKSSQPISMTGEEGKPFKLACQPPDGWPKPIVHWIYFYTNGGFKTINSSRMTLDPEGNLWFSNLTTADVTSNFMYACAATSPTKYEYKYGNRVLLNVISAGVSAVLNKVEPVLQYVTRKNEVAYRGKQSEMFCIFGGTPLPQTVWKKNGRLINSDRITQGNYGKSLIIKVADFEDEGTYTCEVSNGVGEAKSYSINLRVLAVPYFIKEPEKQNKAEDETVEFVCEAGGSPEPDIKWIHNGRPITETPDNPRRKVYKNRIIIERLVKNDTGNYGCNATNSLGYVYKDVYINVLSLAPEIVETPRDTQVVDVQDVNMTCKVLGAPNPNVKWIRNGKELTGGRYEVQENGDLLIHRVQFDDQGNYTCYAENKLGNASASARLDVKAHTYISDGPEDYEVEARSSATFRCVAVSDPSLNLEILWLKNDQQIDFDGEPRFVKTADDSLTITKTIELDSGTYTCLAKTDLDEASAKAQLTVQDVPNPPEMKSVRCNIKDATISWMPMGDNRAPILYYKIQYNTSFTPDEWKDAYSHVPAAEMTYNIPLSPWANYTFRVIAVNKIGMSTPSDHSETICETKPEVPHKNPDNVKGEGDRPDNLVITWTPMPQIEHNAPGFKYRIYWKRDIPGKDYEDPREITDFKIGRYVVPNQPSFQQYRIKVVAANEMGDASVSPQEVIGFSGENEPELAPANFTLLSINDPRTALLSWDPVPRSSVRGHFRGYKIKIWSDRSLSPKEIQVQGGNSKALVNNFDPYTKNYAQVYVFNNKYSGPPSEILSFDTPEGEPGEMQNLEAIPLGSSAFLLKWEKPYEENGILTGYNIYYAEVDSSMKVNQPVPRNPQITDPEVKRAKLGGLKPNTNYRIYITATTKRGESKQKYFIERQTKPAGEYPPSNPNFEYKVIQEGNTARRANPNTSELKNEDKEDYLKVSGLEPASVYDFVVTSVDGQFTADTEPQEVSTYDIEGPTIRAQENVATAGWFIGMMLAVAFLLLVLIIVCIFKRNRGGKYAVHEREQANGRHDYPDEGGFHEYSQPLDNKSHGRASMGSEPKIGPESDTDSMAEYGDGDTEGMNEDGSFIGQYGRKRGQGETTSQGFATLV